jgi:hypothetical protein
MALTWVSDITGALTSSFTELTTSIMEAINNGFTKLFLVTDTAGAVTGVSDFGKFTFVCLGISLAIGLTKFVTSLVRRKI